MARRVKGLRVTRKGVELGEVVPACHFRRGWKFLRWLRQAESFNDDRERFLFKRCQVCPRVRRAKILVQRAAQDTGKHAEKMRARAIGGRVLVDFRSDRETLRAENLNALIDDEDVHVSDRRCAFAIGEQDAAVWTKARRFKAVRLDDVRAVQVGQIDHILHFHAVSPLREWRATRVHSRVSIRGETKRGRRGRDGFAGLSPRFVARSDCTSDFIVLRLG